MFRLVRQRLLQTSRSASEDLVSESLATFRQVFCEGNPAQLWSCTSGRGFAKIPGSEPLPSSSRPKRFGTRKGLPAEEQAPSQAASGSDISAEAHASNIATLQRETAATASAWMFPWEKRQMDGGKQPLRTWEKVYWGVFVTGFSVFLLSRVSVWTSAEPEDPAIAERREENRMRAARLMLAGQPPPADDPFDGLTPQEIQQYVDKATNGATSSDPFEGMSPEEINDFMQQQGTAATG